MSRENCRGIRIGRIKDRGLIVTAMIFKPKMKMSKQGLVGSNGKATEGGGCWMKDEKWITG